MHRMAIISILSVCSIGVTSLVACAPPPLATRQTPVEPAAWSAAPRPLQPRPAVSSTAPSSTEPSAPANPVLADADTAPPAEPAEAAVPPQPGPGAPPPPPPAGLPQLPVPQLPGLPPLPPVPPLGQVPELPVWRPPQEVYNIPLPAQPAVHLPGPLQAELNKHLR